MSYTSFKWAKSHVKLYLSIVVMCVRDIQVLFSTVICILLYLCCAEQRSRPLKSNNVKHVAAGSNLTNSLTASHFDDNQ